MEQALKAFAVHDVTIFCTNRKETYAKDIVCKGILNSWIANKKGLLVIW